MNKFSKVVDMGFDYKEDYKYSLFLFGLFAFFFLPSFFPDRLQSLLTTILFVGLIITSILLVESKSKFKRGIVLLTGLVGILILLSDRFMDVPAAIRLAGYLILVIMFFTLFHELLIQIFKSEKITLNVVLGAFSGYVMIGIIGFFVIYGLYLIQPGSYKISGEPINDLFYYSFITLSTIGYGDISPLTIPAKNIAVILGLVGQFYNAIVMAAIIGKFLQSDS
jgi:voltage-gated potassium channel